MCCRDEGAWDDDGTLERASDLMHGKHYSPHSSFPNLTCGARIPPSQIDNRSPCSLPSIKWGHDPLLPKLETAKPPLIHTSAPMTANPNHHMRIFGHRTPSSAPTATPMLPHPRHCGRPCTIRSHSCPRTAPTPPLSWPCHTRHHRWDSSPHRLTVASCYSSDSTRSSLAVRVASPALFLGYAISS